LLGTNHAGPTLLPHRRQNQKKIHTQRLAYEFLLGYDRISLPAPPRFGAGKIREVDLSGTVLSLQLLCVGLAGDTGKELLTWKVWLLTDTGLRRMAIGNGYTLRSAIAGLWSFYAFAKRAQTKIPAGLCSNPRESWESA
jgi:hypothetical protein